MTKNTKRLIEACERSDIVTAAELIGRGANYMDPKVIRAAIRDDGGELIEYLITYGCVTKENRVELYNLAKDDCFNEIAVALLPTKEWFDAGFDQEGIESTGFNLELEELLMAVIRRRDTYTATEIQRLSYEHTDIHIKIIELATHNCDPKTLFWWFSRLTTAARSYIESQGSGDNIIMITTKDLIDIASYDY